MAIDKALYAAPQGLEAISAEQTPIEIEIEDPESVTIGLDGLPSSLLSQRMERKISLMRTWQIKLIQVS